MWKRKLEFGLIAGNVYGWRESRKSRSTALTLIAFVLGVALAELFFVALSLNIHGY